MMERSRDIEVEVTCANPDCKKEFKVTLTIFPLRYEHGEDRTQKEYVEACPWCKMQNLIKLPMDQ